MALGALCLVHAVLWTSVQTENVIEYVLVLCCCYLCGAFVFDTFPLISNEVDLRFFGYS